eukprot:g6491.t1
MMTQTEQKKERRDVVGGMDMEAASIEELNQKISTLEKEKNKEEEYRNYMQLERDKINAFWEITKKELDDKRAELRNKDREIEEMEERQQVEIKVYKQKVKHLLYEHQNNVTTFKTETELQKEIRETQFETERVVWNEHQLSLKQQLREKELSDEDFIRQLKLDQAKEITKIRQSFELQAKQLKDIYEKKMKRLRDELELRRKAEIHEIEERKNLHINELMHSHQRSFLEIKNYYNDITHNNLDLIKTLKEDVADMKKKEVQNEKLMYEIAQENKRLSDPLNAALKEVETLRQHLANYEEDKRSFSATKARLSSAMKDVKNLEWENEVLTQRLDKVSKEREQANTNRESEMFQFQQKSSLQCAYLEKKINALKHELDKKEAQVAEILVTANMDSAEATKINTKLDEILENKDSKIKSLELSVAQLKKAYSDLIKICSAKLEEAGVPHEDFTLQSLSSKIGNLTLC